MEGGAKGGLKAKGGDAAETRRNAKVLPASAAFEDILSRIQQELPGIETIGAINDPQAIVKALTRIREVFLFSVSLAAKYGALQQQFDELKQQQAQQQQLGGGGGAAEGVTVAALQGEIEAMKQQHKKEMEDLTKAYEEKIAAALKGVAKQEEVAKLQGQVAVQGKAVVEVRKTGDKTARAVQQVAKEQGRTENLVRERRVILRGMPKAEADEDIVTTMLRFMQQGLKYDQEDIGVVDLAELKGGKGADPKTANAVMTLRSVVCKKGLFNSMKKLKGTKFAGVRVDDDLTKENRAKQQAMLVKRREMLKKKEAEAVVVRNHNMEPVMVAKIGGVWRVVTAKPEGGRWDPDRALSYKWEMSREARGAERPRDRQEEEGCEQ